MAISTLDNFDYKGKKPNFARDIFDTIADMAAFSENYLPDMFIASCLEDGKTYVFNRSNSVDVTLGKWRQLEGAVEESGLKNEIVAGTDIGLIKSGETYAIGTSIEDILKDLLSGETIAADEFYYGVSNDENIISLYQFTGSTSSICTVAPDNQYVVFAVKKSLGEPTIKDENGFRYNSEFNKTTITHNGVEYDVYVSKYKMTTSGFTYILSM